MSENKNYIQQSELQQELSNWQPTYNLDWTRLPDKTNREIATHLSRLLLHPETLNDIPIQENEIPPLEISLPTHPHQSKIIRFEAVGIPDSGKTTLLAILGFAINGYNRFNEKNITPIMFLEHSSRIDTLVYNLYRLVNKEGSGGNLALEKFLSTLLFRLKYHSHIIKLRSNISLGIDKNPFIEAILRISTLFPYIDTNNLVANYLSGDSQYISFIDGGPWTQAIFQTYELIGAIKNENKEFLILQVDRVMNYLTMGINFIEAVALLPDFNYIIAKSRWDGWEGSSFNCPRKWARIQNSYRIIKSLIMSLETGTEYRRSICLPDLDRIQLLSDEHEPTLSQDKERWDELMRIISMIETLSHQ